MCDGTLHAFLSFVVQIEQVFLNLAFTAIDNGAIVDVSVSYGRSIGRARLFRGLCFLLHTSLATRIFGEGTLVGMLLQVLDAAC
ncbi:unnamed protein product [Heligmosomoides polygyrus]|uniref:Secreted protein n=1 Tax=Heligmosomoides polygyrus TaxID=6339 RepID=A0A183GJN5_HELPZ|nr:unnamed protein product [Heligmosomoides polygyrus]